MIQGNVPREGLEFNAQRRAVLANHVRQTLKLADDVAAPRSPRPTVVLWPENSSDIDLFINTDAATQIQRAADAINAPILVGAVVNGPGDGARDMAIMWWPSGAEKPGPGQIYTKRHPAPFAEYVPYRDFFSKITPMVDQVRAGFVAGQRVGTFEVSQGDAQPLVIGDVICFEVAYDDLVTDTIARGAQILTIQTNNATFGHTREADQQFAMSRIRAVEHNRAVLSASTSGISGIILPDGTVVGEVRQVCSGDVRPVRASDGHHHDRDSGGRVAGVDHVRRGTSRDRAGIHPAGTGTHTPMRARDDRQRSYAAI